MKTYRETLIAALILSPLCYSCEDVKTGYCLIFDSLENLKHFLHSPIYQAVVECDESGDALLELELVLREVI